MSVCLFVCVCSCAQVTNTTVERAFVTQVSSPVRPTHACPVDVAAVGGGCLVLFGVSRLAHARTLTHLHTYTHLHTPTHTYTHLLVFVYFWEGGGVGITRDECTELENKSIRHRRGREIPKFFFVLNSPGLRFGGGRDEHGKGRRGGPRGRESVANGLF